MRKAGPWLAVVAVLLATTLQLHIQGRLWVCSCGHFALWVGDAWGHDTSQQLFDPYTFTHVLHGFVVCGVLAWGLPRMSWAWRLWIAVFAESFWEVVENTNFVIQRYREATAARRMSSKRGRTAFRCDDVKVTAAPCGALCKSWATSGFF